MASGGGASGKGAMIVNGRVGVANTGHINSLTVLIGRKRGPFSALAAAIAIVVAAVIVAVYQPFAARTPSHPPASIASHASAIPVSPKATASSHRKDQAARVPPVAQVHPTLQGPLDFSSSTIAMGLHANQYEDVFGLDQQGQVIHSVMGSTTGNWGPWEPFGSPGTAVAVAVAADSNQLLHVVLVMTNGSIEERSEEALNRWGDWSAIAGTGEAKAIGLGEDHNGCLEVFAVAPGGKLVNRTQLTPGGSNWTGWTPANLPGTVRSVAVIRKMDGYLDVMAVMADGSINWEDEDQDGWRPWILLSPPEPAVQVTIGQNADGMEVVFALTAGGTIENMWEEDESGHPWSAWQQGFGPSCQVTSIDAGAQAQQRLAVLAVCSDGTMQDRFEPSPDTQWTETSPDGQWTASWKEFPQVGSFGVGSPST